MSLLWGPLQEAKKRHSIDDPINGTFQISKLKKTGLLKREGEVGKYIPGEPNQERLSLVYEINLLKYTKQYFYGILHLSLQRSHLTDYFLPFILALFALLYGLAGKWEGALFNVIRSLYS